MAWPPKSLLRCTDLDIRERIRKYDLGGTDGQKLTNDALRDYLLEKVAAARSEVRLDVVLRGLRFDDRLADPHEKVVGRVFQYVDKMQGQNGAVGVFVDKGIAKYLLRAVEPRELRERIESEI